MAVKIVEHSAGAKAAEQIMREAVLATSVSHPNIVSGWLLKSFVCVVGNHTLRLALRRALQSSAEPAGRLRVEGTQRDHSVEHFQGQQMVCY